MKVTALGRSLVLAAVLFAALVAEFFVLEGTIGISIPPDRNSALSTLEIREKGRAVHFITSNKRFTVIEFWTTRPSRIETLVLRETFFSDREEGREGPPEALVTVEALNGSKVKWTLREPGERGEAVTDNLYMVTAYGNGETGNLYTYFALSNGRKVQTSRYAPLDTGALTKLDGSVAE